MRIARQPLPWLWPPYLAAFCVLLSAVQVAGPLLWARFDSRASAELLPLVGVLFLPYILLLVLPLWSVFGRARSFVKGLLWYGAVTFVLFQVRDVLIAQVTMPVGLSSDAIATVCIEASSSLKGPMLVDCFARAALSTLITNALGWALPVILLECLLRGYADLRAGSAKPL